MFASLETNSKSFSLRFQSPSPHSNRFNRAVFGERNLVYDLLVKLAIEGENTTYAPRVDSNQFLTVAKKYYGLDPPD